MKQWNDSKAIMDYAVATGFEKGIEKGREEGREEALQKVFSLLRQGYSVDEAEKKLGLS